MATTPRVRRFRTLNSKNIHARLEELFVRNTLSGDEERPFDGYMFETFGAEIELVRTVQQTAPARIVTILEGESSAWWVVSGFHYVNRIGYLVAKEGVILPDFKDFSY